MTRSYEALLSHADAGDSTGDMDTSHDVTLASRRAMEMDQEHWQNGKTYES